MTTPAFRYQGLNHVALVCRDMKETVDFYTNVLGFPLVKTVDLPGGRGQHFFFDIGNGNGQTLAFFWFPEAPEGEKGVTRQSRAGVTAVGTMNHLAFDVPADRFDAYRQRLLDKGVEVTPIINHANSLDGGHKQDFDPATDGEGQSQRHDGAGSEGAGL